MTNETPPNPMQAMLDTMSPEEVLALAQSYPSGNQSTECPANLAELTKLAADLKEQHEVSKAQTDALSKRLTETQETILSTLDLMGIDSVRAHGFLFFTAMESSVKTPKTVEEKKKLFDYLESRGMFLEMVSVNSQTLNSLYKSLSEEAAKAGNLDFKLPGVEEPKPYPKLKMRRG